ncbi:MAG: linear amide C-N hydrolase [Hyphomicrobiaceae bacterium]|nr:linear amide C-N hydrolase [Hyphomicrobiaceae bacterium]
MRFTSRLLAGALCIGLAAPAADACTRILYETGDGTYIVGRTLDWFEDTKSNLWVLPRGVKQNGGLGEGSLEWTSKYGSIVTTIYDIAGVDGMNEKGLVTNALYLAESDFGNARATGKPLLSIGGWMQYVLDNFATVAEAVEALRAEPFAIIAPILPDGKPAVGHLSISDKSGDSAIFEYLKGKLVIHHGHEYTVMTNSPPFDEQLAVTTYWDQVGGLAMLPGTHRASDRFARVSWNLNASPKFKDPRIAVASVFSIIRSVSVPLGIADPDRPNIASTTWRTVSDVARNRYYFESAFSPNIFWVDLDKLKFDKGAPVRKLDLTNRPIIAGESSDLFLDAKPYTFLGQ